MNASNTICRPDDAGNEWLEEMFLEEINTLCEDAFERGCGVVLSTPMRQTFDGQSVAFRAVVAGIVELGECRPEMAELLTLRLWPEIWRFCRTQPWNLGEFNWFLANGILYCNNLYGT